MSFKEKIREKFDKSIELATEKKNNESIKKMCEVVTDLITKQTDDACIVSVGFMEDLQKLYELGIVSGETKQNYIAIIDLANQVYQGKTIPIEYIKEAAEVLNEEIEISENNDIKPINVDEEIDRKVNESNAIQNIGNENITYDENGNPQVGETNANDNNPYSNFQNPYDNNILNQSNGNNKFYPQGPKQINPANDFDYNVQKNQGRGNFNPRRINRNIGLNIGDIIAKIFDINVQKNSIPPFVRILVPIVCIFLFVSVVRAVFFTSRVPNNIKNTQVQQTTEAPTIESTEETEETEPIIETTTEAGTYIVTKDEVRVREEPNTNATTRVYTYVDRGTEVQVDRFYNDEWALIKFDGKELFISRSYITRKEN